MLVLVIVLAYRISNPSHYEYDDEQEHEHEMSDRGSAVFLRQHLIDHISGDVRQPEVAALVGVG